MIDFEELPVIDEDSFHAQRKHMLRAAPLQCHNLLISMSFCPVSPPKFGKLGGLDVDFMTQCPDSFVRLGEFYVGTSFYYDRYLIF